ncbi:MAG: alternative ribosome rescue aminoacyl-tRNA hydrolase ArfB [Pirellulales bacterium]
MLQITSQLQIPREEFTFTFARSSGPGGQNVNKVNSKALLRWPVLASPSLPEHVRTRFLTLYRTRITTEGDLLLTSQRYRDAPKNVDDCLEKLRQMLLAAATVPKRRRATKPSRSSIKRRREDKASTSRKKQSRRSPRDE